MILIYIYTLIFTRLPLASLQKSGGGESGFSDVAKHPYAMLKERDNLPEGLDLQHKEVKLARVLYFNS